MRRTITSLAVLVALATPATLLVSGVTPAGATTPKSITCTSVVGTATTSVTISKCSVPAADAKTYASVKASNVSSLSSGGTIKWSSSAKTTVFKITSLVTSGTKCGTSTEIVAKGSVTGGTAAVTAKGQAVSGSICLNAGTGKISIVPGTKVDL